MVLLEGLRFGMLGVGIGIAAALVLTRGMRAMVYGVDTADPITFGALSLLLLVVAGLASALPARRAAHVDPMVALRME
jgi:ABC-type antimicrobial peptide transport system permease subunit